MAFIDSPLGGFFASLTAGFTFLDKLGEGLNALILSDIPAHEQRQIEMRMRRCKTHCRKAHYDSSKVYTLVSIDFEDKSIDFQTKVAQLICFELNIKN